MEEVLWRQRGRLDVPSGRRAFSRRSRYIFWLMRAPANVLNEISVTKK